MDKNIENLIELITKNPVAEIVIMVDDQVIGSEDYSRWAGRIGKSRLDEYYCNGDERIYYKSSDKEELREQHIDNIYIDFREGEISGEELEKMGDEYLQNIEWKEAIIVNVDTY